MGPTIHAGAEHLETSLAHILQSPRDHGVVELIVARPAVGERQVVDQAVLSTDHGLNGDTWAVRRSRNTADGSADPLRQLTLMNARAIAAVAGEMDNWAAAGDQLFVDLDISHTNLPAGSLLALGPAVIEITEPPHTGCDKFRARYGADAVRWINSPTGRELRLRGVNARVVIPGKVQQGDVVHKVD